MNTSPAIQETCAKYGWRVEELPLNAYQLFNRNNKPVVRVVIAKSGRYTVFNSGGCKIMTGYGQLPQSIERLLTQFYYCQPIT